MKSIKRTKIAAMLLLMMLLMGVGQATMPAWPLVEETEDEIFLTGKPPKVGEVFEVIYRVRLKPDVSSDFGNRNFYIKFATGSSFRAEIIDNNEIVIPGLIPGEWREFRGRFRIPEPYKMVFINAKISYVSGSYALAGASLRLYLIDAEIGQYGTKEEQLNKVSNVFWKYDHISAQWLTEPDQRWEESNRKIAEEMKKFEPALSDSEALLLHSDQYRVGHPKGIPTWDKTTQTWNEQEIFEYYLKDNWFKALREGKREEWLKKEKQEIADTWKERRLNFFRADNNSSSSGQYITYRISKEFKGVWRFKDHLYSC